MSKFILKYTKGETYKVTKPNKQIVEFNTDFYHLMWVDADGKKITDWSWSGKNWGKSAPYKMTEKLLQIKSVMPDMILEHDMGENPLFVSTQC